MVPEVEEVMVEVKVDAVVEAELRLRFGELFQQYRILRPGRDTVNL